MVGLVGGGFGNAELVSLIGVDDAIDVVGIGGGKRSHGALPIEQGSGLRGNGGGWTGGCNLGVEWCVEVLISIFSSCGEGSRMCCSTSWCRSGSKVIPAMAKSLSSEGNVRILASSRYFTLRHLPPAAFLDVRVPIVPCQVWIVFGIEIENQRIVKVVPSFVLSAI